MEMLKVTFTSKFIDDSGLSIQYLYGKVAEVATDPKRYYTKDSTDEFDDEKFTQIMFLDGCFILQFISCFLHRPEDLNMPESFKEMIKKFVGKCICKQAHKMWGNEETEDHRPAHLLGLLYTDHINKEACSNCSRRSSDWYSYHSAKDLRTVGIRFRPNWTNAYSDVEFQSSLRGIN
ncbi:hypothetical protein DKX38_023296 [Salix brachista]|uniref:Uncharacterized protein n=1 Tax=Salix brachista TaxID=2182728 RepID=A0A5N5JWA4_9ROSI|nr:hypothetical protein DKX38_023296 [Salix brachista]